MFVTCPNCKELIPKKAGPCPMCKHEVAAEFILKIEQEERRETEYYTREKKAIFRERKYLAIVLECIFYVVAVLTGVISFVLGHEGVGTCIVIAEFLILVVVAHFTKCWQCPYCSKYYEGYFIRGFNLQTDWCPHCGGRLR